MKPLLRGALDSPSLVSPVPARWMEPFMNVPVQMQGCIWSETKRVLHSFNVQMQSSLAVNKGRFPSKGEQGLSAH